jgi:hypothetical protein
MESIVCKHPERKRIDQMILAGMSLRKIGQSVSPPVSHQTVKLYKDLIVKPAIASMSLPNLPLTDDRQGALQRTAAAASPVRERVQELWTRTQRNLDAVEETATKPEHLGLVAPLLAQAHKNVEILGQLTGELSSAASGPQIAISIVVPAGERTPDLAVDYDGQTIDIKAG